MGDSNTTNSKVSSTGDLLLSDNTKVLFGDIRDSPYWNIFLLAIAWSLTLTTSTLLTTIGPLSAVYLGASDTLAAFTIGVFLIGAAVSSVPSGWLFRVHGRFKGFSVGCICQIIGSGMGSFAMLTSSLYALYIACFFIGLGQGLGQFYRFSAVELTPKELKSSAVTYVLAGGVLAAFLGPTGASYSANLFSQDYQGSFVIIAGVGILNQATIMLVKFPPAPAKTLQNVDDVPKRSNYEIVSQPLFIVSCAVATIAHTIMIMIMSNVSVDMSNNGYSFDATALVMELHFFAMFSPGFISGSLIGQYGAFGVALVGGLIFVVSSTLLVVGTSLWNYILGMILVGIAWNLSFSAGTVMLTKTYKSEEATNVQAINDFILFTIAGAGSLLSGLLYSEEGWFVLIMAVSGLMGLYLLLFTVIYCYSIQLKEVQEDEVTLRQAMVKSPLVTTGPNGEPKVSISDQSLSEDSDLYYDKRSMSSVSVTSLGDRRSNFLQDYERHVSFSAVRLGEEGEREREINFVRTMSVT